VNVSTLTVAPRTSVLGTAPDAEPWHGFTPKSTRDHVALRAATTDMDTWYRHIAPAAACTRPVRLSGHRMTIDSTTGRVLANVDTSRMPDATIYKACGNRRAAVCPACARTYQRDAYQLLRAGLVGGKGIPDTVATHPAVFVTLTAPSFGPVHTRVVGTHTCTNRKRCDCRPNPCRARTGPADTGLCTHGQTAVCFARHEANDPRLGRPLCLDCYDHNHHVVWNLYSGELWRRTKQAAERHLAQLAEQRGIPPVVTVSAAGKAVERPPVVISHGKAAEFQARAAVHFHALLRLDGIDPHSPTAIIPPPAGFSIEDLTDAIRAAAHVTFTTSTHPDRAAGWPMAWGEQVDVRPIALSGGNQVTDQMVAGYLAKYATKSTEATGHQSTRITAETIDVYADPDGDHIARLIDACWRLGRPQAAPVPLSQRPARRVKALGDRWTCPDCGTATRLRICAVCHPSRQESLDTKTAGSATTTDVDNPYARLRRWAHMLGFGGHFLTKARHYSVTFGLLRAARIDFRRTEDTPDDPVMRAADHLDEETTLIVGTLSFAGVGWHNTGDALLANTSAALARARHQAARDELAHETGTALLAQQQTVAA